LHFASNFVHTSFYGCFCDKVRELGIRLSRNGPYDVVQVLYDAVVLLVTIIGWLYRFRECVSTLECGGDGVVSTRAEERRTNPKTRLFVQNTTATTEKDVGFVLWETGSGELRTWTGRAADEGTGVGREDGVWSFRLVGNQTVVEYAGDSAHVKWFKRMFWVRWWFRWRIYGMQRKEITIEDAALGETTELLDILRTSISVLVKPYFVFLRHSRCLY
jgi:hypothetical protein